MTLAIAPPAFSQRAAQGPDRSDVVVTGKRAVPFKQAQRYVRQVVSMNEGQLARFMDPVCPQVLGVRTELATAIVQRFRQTATDAGVRLAPGTCQANVMIVLVPDSDSFIKLVRKRHSSFFDDLQGVDLHDAFRSGSVHSWRLIETRDDEGNGGGRSSDDGPSMYASETQAVTVNSVVVIDEHVVLGKSSQQIGDYAVMRTLAGARPPQKASTDANTILSLFDANVSPAPIGLTTMDRSFLAGLYAANAETHDAVAQANDISRRMAAGPASADVRRSGQRRH